jgi:hypothetical protein
MVVEGWHIQKLARWNREKSMVSWTPYENPIELLLHYCSILTRFKPVLVKLSLRMNLSLRITFHSRITSSFLDQLL